MSNDLGFRIGDQWILNPVPFGEIAKDCLRVVADGSQTDAVLLELSRAFCNWTSCCLQKDHQSADRKNNSATPFGPISDDSVCSFPN